MRRRGIPGIALLATTCAVGLAACGDDPAATDAAPADAVTIDARPDAFVPDAMPGRFDCLGEPLPTTADDPIDVGGVATEISAGGEEPVEGVVITLFSAADAELGTATTDATGAYSVEVATGGTPITGYLRAIQKGYLDTYLYPPRPLAASTTAAAATMITSGTFDLLGSLALGDAPADGMGHVVVVVVDCNDDPVQGAVVTSSPAGTVRYNAGGFPSDTATATGADGIAYVFNLTPGTVSVDASFDGTSLREHDVTARADVLTTTIVGP